MLPMAVSLSVPEPNLIVSSSGFEIRVLGRTGLLYIEGARSVRIDSEVLATPASMMVATTSLRVWEGPDPASVSEDDRERIAENIRRAFAACGYHAELHGEVDWDSVAIRRRSGGES
jgi:hypothetical protein